MKPKNKSRLMEWLKGNLGVRFQLVYKYLISKDGLLFRDEEKTLERVLVGVQTNAIMFRGENIKNDTTRLKLTNIKARAMEFTDDYFALNIQGEHGGYDYNLRLEYRYEDGAVSV